MKRLKKHTGQFGKVIELGLKGEIVRFLTHSAAIAFARRNERQWVIFWGKDDQYYWVCSPADGEILLAAGYRPEGQYSSATADVTKRLGLNHEPFEFTTVELAKGYITYHLREDSIFVGDRGCFWVCRSSDVAKLIQAGYRVLNLKS